MTPIHVRSAALGVIRSSKRATPCGKTHPRPKREHPLLALTAAVGTTFSSE